MKNLLLIRHAKSSWNLPGLDDHDRPLNDRGNRDAPKMGQALRQRGVLPDIMLSSTAKRAVETASLLAEELEFPSNRIQTSRDLYLASPEAILRAVSNLDESADIAMLFGHNPGMMQATSDLSDGSLQVSKFPTLSIARFELSIDFWGEIERGCGLLLEHLYPKALID